MSRILFLILLAAAPLLATNTAGDPTDITNWPPCAQKCIPEGFVPPASCSSLSDLECICRRGQFTAQIAACEQTSCSSQERKDINTLSTRLCAPVGGFGPSLSSTISAFFSSSQLSLSTTPTIAPTITKGSQVSSILATATPAPNLGNAANILTYPLCAQICSNETARISQQVGAPFPDLTNTKVACSPEFRAATAGCEAATCSPADYQTTQLLAQQLCGYLYQSNATLSSSVASAIASATAAAKLATEGKDPTDLSVLPPCAQECIPQQNYYGCGSLSNLECICQGIRFNTAIGPCETSICSAADLQTIVFLAEKLCEPVGGVLTHPVNYTGNATASSSLVPFTGEAAAVGAGGLGMVIAAVMVGVGVLIL